MENRYGYFFENLDINNPYRGGPLHRREEGKYDEYDKRQDTWTFTNLFFDRLSSKIDYKDGVKEGNAIYFYDDTEWINDDILNNPEKADKPLLKAVGTFKNDKLNGYWRFFDQRGNITDEGNFSDDKYYGLWKSDNYLVNINYDPVEDFYYGEFTVFKDGVAVQKGNFSSKGKYKNIYYNESEAPLLPLSGIISHSWDLANEEEEFYDDEE